MSSSAVVATPPAVPKGGEDPSVHTPSDGALNPTDPSRRQKDLYAQLKALQKRLEFLNIQVIWHSSSIPTSSTPLAFFVRSTSSSHVRLLAGPHTCIFPFLSHLIHKAESQYDTRLPSCDGVSRSLDS